MVTWSGLSYSNESHLINIYIQLDDLLFRPHVIRPHVAEGWPTLLSHPSKPGRFEGRRRQGLSAAHDQARWTGGRPRWAGVADGGMEGKI